MLIIFTLVIWKRSPEKYLLFSSHFSQLISIIFHWLIGMYFHDVRFSNYEAWYQFFIFFNYYISTLWEGFVTLWLLLFLLCFMSFNFMNDIFYYVPIFIIFYWLIGMYFHDARFSNYETWYQFFIFFNCCISTLWEGFVMLWLLFFFFLMFYEFWFNEWYILLCQLIFIIFYWLIGKYFHDARFSNYEAWYQFFYLFNCCISTLWEGFVT